MNNKKGMVIYTFAGMGTTTFCKKFDNVIDLEEDSFRYLEKSSGPNNGLNRIINPEFPQNYFKAIEESIKKYDYVFVGHNALKYCQDKAIDYMIFLPKLKDKDAYIKRYEDECDLKVVVDNLNLNFETCMKKEGEDRYAEKIIYLNSNEFISNWFKKTGLIRAGKCLAYSNETVSLIIPIHNAEKYLPRLFKSIAAQSYKNLEIILVNDSSVDNTSGLCKEFCKNFANGIYFEKQFKSASKTRNFGLTVATGKYICFVDSDDTLESEYVRKLHSAMKTNNSDMVMSGLYEIRNGIKSSYGPPAEGSGTNNNAEFFVGLFNNCWFPVPWNKMFKRSLILNNKISFPKNINYDEDTVFNFRYYNVARKITIIPDNLYNYYINEGSLTKKGDENIFAASLKTIMYRINYPISLFGENKQAVYISAKKILKAVLQEGKAMFKQNPDVDMILQNFHERLKNRYVIKATKYITMLENDYNEYYKYKKVFEDKDENAFLELIR